jgi:putative ABC transport system substrate-binding protein
MRRRDFIKVIAGSAAAWPLAARGQQPMPVIGALYSVSAADWTDNIAGLRSGLSEAGFIEGRNVAIEFRWAEGQFDRLPAMAADLISRKVTVIVAGGSVVGVRAAIAATQSIPIVFTTGTDPVATGLVSSLSRPGGNVTGITLLAGQLVPKLLELLREVRPAASTIAMLVNPNNPMLTQVDIEGGGAAATRFGLKMIVVRAGSEREIDEAFASAVQQRADALVTEEAYFASRQVQIASLGLRHRLPVVTGAQLATETGILMSYGASIPDIYRQAGIYVGRILKGERPGDLPVMQPTKFKLNVNLKTAKALGITIPESFLVRADDVIE